MFCLLVREAIAKGVRVPPDEFEQQLQQINVRLEDGRVVPFSGLAETELADEVRRSVHDLMLVNESFKRPGGSR